VNVAVTVSVYVPAGVSAGTADWLADPPPPPQEVIATAAISTKIKTDARAMRLHTRRRKNPAAHKAAIKKTAICKAIIFPCPASGGQQIRFACERPGWANALPETGCCVGTLTLNGVSPVSATESGEGVALHEASVGAPAQEIVTLPENPFNEFTCKL
jgi:hypothetical protein